MTRPCQLRHPDPRDHAGPEQYTPAACRLCWLYLHRADYRRRWGDADGSAPTPLPPPPCPYFGPLIPPADRERFGVGNVRDWHLCTLNLPLVRATCNCLHYPRGCGGCPHRPAAAG